MDTDDRVYVQLQRHMDSIGLIWPATPSKSELRISSLTPLSSSGSAVHRADQASH